jgi:hypothetical protein
MAFRITVPDLDGQRRTAPDSDAADLDRLEQAQCSDGGWPVDFTSYSAAASLEWRGHATVRAVEVLRANGRTGNSQVPVRERG